MKALDVEAVQAFVLVADLKSFTRAAEAMETTQSAVSLKIKRLEDGLGRRLLERTPRLVRLSADGSTFLGPARALVAAHQGAVGSFGVTQRRLVIGISHHIVGAELPALLKRMSSAEPGLMMEMRVSMSREILDDFDRGVLDAAIVLRHDNRRRDGEVILEETFGWMAAPDFVHRPGEPLRLATQAEPCSVRGMALAGTRRGGDSMDRGVRRRRRADNRRRRLRRAGRCRAQPPCGPAGHNRCGPSTRPAAAAVTRCDPLLESDGSAGAQFAQNSRGRDPIDRHLNLTVRNVPFAAASLCCHRWSNPDCRQSARI